MSNLLNRRSFLKGMVAASEALLISRLPRAGAALPTAKITKVKRGM